MYNGKTLKDLDGSERAGLKEYFEDLKESCKENGKKCSYFIDYDFNVVYVNGKVFEDLDELDDYLIREYM